MGIYSTILGLSPLAYWPLNELSGPTAYDASLHGRDGTYQAGVGFAIQGPEVSTNAVYRQAPGAIARSAAPVTPLASGPFSCMFYMAVPQWTGPDHAHIADVLDAGLTGAQGWTLDVHGSSLAGPQGALEIVRQSAGLTGLGTAPLDSNYHQYCLVYNSTDWRLYFDGVLAYTVAPGGYLSPALPALLCQLPAAGVMAHFAVWSSALTIAEVATVPAARSSPMEPPWVGSGIVDPTLLANIQAILNAVTIRAY